MKHFSVLAVFFVFAMPIGAQVRHKPIAALRWSDGVSLSVEGVSDSSVHVDVIQGVRVAIPHERVDYFRAFLSSADSLLGVRLPVERGEYVDFPEVGGGQIRIVKRLFADSARYIVSFYGTGTTTPIVATASARDFTALVAAMQAADTAARRLSLLPANWDQRRR